MQRVQESVRWSQTTGWGAPCREELAEEEPVAGSPTLASRGPSYRVDWFIGAVGQKSVSRPGSKS